MEASTRLKHCKWLAEKSPDSTGCCWGHDGHSHGYFIALKDWESCAHMVRIETDGSVADDLADAVDARIKVLLARYRRR